MYLTFISILVQLYHSSSLPEIRYTITGTCSQPGSFQNKLYAGARKYLLAHLN